MTVAFFRHERYEPLASAALYETEYEDVIAADADVLFPSFRLVPFKTTVRSEHGSKKPDFALIDRQYRSWWVVEVELAHHSFGGHVLPQVQVLANALYGETEARYLADADPHLDLERLRAMMRGDQPRVLVVVNEPCPTWELELRFLNAVLLVVRIFRSDRNAHMLVADGEFPRVSQELVTNCRRDPMIARFLLVEAPGALDVGADQSVAVLYRDRLTRWKRLDSVDRVWLVPIASSDSIDPTTTRVAMIRIDGERLEFRDL